MELNIYIFQGPEAPEHREEPGTLQAAAVRDLRLGRTPGDRLHRGHPRPGGRQLGGRFPQTQVLRKLAVVCR